MSTVGKPRIASEAEEREIEDLFQLQLKQERHQYEWRYYPVQESPTQQTKQDQKSFVWVIILSIISGLIVSAAWVTFLFLIMKGR